jgi:hypothetical protein
VPLTHRSHGSSPGSDLKLPAAHAMHNPSFRVYPALHWQALLLAVEPAFASHAVHDDEPAGENVLGGQERHIDAGKIVEPKGHVEHCAEDAAPVKGTGRCVPAGQETHVPDTSGHVVQVAIEDAPRTDEYLPRLQLIHVAAEKAPLAVEYFPALHFTHRLSEDAPVKHWYLPDPHCIHEAEDVDPTRVEYVPTAQSKQVVEAVIAECFPAKQRRQLSEDVDPSAVENLPAEHLVHTVEDRSALYLPA